jgi:hypothetical protein
MTKNVGYFGGHSIYTLGPSFDVQAFFNAVQRLIPAARNSSEYDLITDRLFRRYLHKDQLDKSLQLMQSLDDEFNAIANKNIDWHSFGVVDYVSKLELTAETVGGVFEKYFELFKKAYESTLSFESEFKIFKPIRLVFADLPDFMLDKTRPLSAYDEPDLIPFWMRT